MADSDLERTEPATGRRLGQAREDGQVPRSRELSAFMVLVCAVAGCWTLSGWISERAFAIMRHGLSFGREAAFGDGLMAQNALVLGREALLLAGPIFFLTIAGALAAPAMMGGWIFTFKPLTLDLNKLNPVSGLKRLVSLNGLGELVKAVFKSLLIGGVVYWMVRHDGDQLFSLMGQSVEVSIHSFFHILFSTAAMLLAGVAIIVLLDVPFQLWQYYHGLRMTKEEVKQEGKEMEGDPQVKGKIRSKQREAARRRMMSEVPKADVVVTNPTHFAVALKYDGSSMSAPVVVAKGVNVLAQRIRELASEAGVPLLEAPPLARALYRHAEVGDQIPAALYTAVAEVMAYVYQLNQFLADGGRSLHAPTTPTDLSVPPELDPGVPDA